MLAHQVFHLRRRGVDQQAVLREQLLQVMILLRVQHLAFQAVQPMPETAPPGGIDFLAQHTAGQFAFLEELQAGLTCLVNLIGLCKSGVDSPACQRSDTVAGIHQATRW
ncbi:hypothetical protein CJU01_20490 [Pseudomonas aeruginosa]|nr:hypothetical protein CJU01_20490 [Pseudomonas aeruginosa]PBX89227.1 hypothetical protein CJT68_22845 [Pseudomonas aeruginosa]PCA91675.1 hypothetical protein CJU02_20795 [Pseudomonas aeruginosa]RQB47707.1 hypothetical protein IPC446_26665 [Pseudomonas aeruginosa]